MQWCAADARGCCRYVRLGSFVEGTAEFDAGAYRLASGEALALDPQARIALEQTQVMMMPRWEFDQTALYSKKKRKN